MPKQSKPSKARKKPIPTKTSEPQGLTACPFCHVPLDETGKHFCTAIREPQAEAKVAVFKCSECAYESGNKDEIVEHHKTAHVPAKSELERIIEVLAWAKANDALHFKCPYFEILFPHKVQTAADLPSKPVMADNARAEAGLADMQKVPFDNPLDDPDYYADAQEKFYNHQRK